MSNSSQFLTDLTGETVNGRWVVRELIGSGDFGWVHSAEDRSRRHSSVVIKFAKDDPDFAFYDAVDCLRKEYEVLRRLNRESFHLRVPTVYEHGTHGEFHYFVMRKLGVSVQHWLDQRNRPASNHSILHICYQLYNIIRQLHENNVAHCDVKLANIVFGRGEHDRDRLYVIDFGESRPALRKWRADDLEEMCRCMVIMFRDGLDGLGEESNTPVVDYDFSRRNRASTEYRRLDEAYEGRMRQGTPIPQAVRAIVRAVFDEDAEISYDEIGHLFRHALWRESSHRR